MIITLDGPSCTGKSSTAFLLAKTLHLLYINSGLLFRAIAYVFNEHSHCAQNKESFFDIIDKELKSLCYSYSIDQGSKMLLDQNDISHLLTTPAIAQLASEISAHPLIRSLVLSWQRRLAVNNNTIVEGRDAGSVVFPEANIKIFLTASTQVRADRWRVLQAQQGILLSDQESYQQITQRDHRDTSRSASPLRVPEHAIIIDNSNLSFEQTFHTIIDHIYQIYPRA